MAVDEVCEQCGGTDDVASLQGCGHAICLSCLRARYQLKKGGAGASAGGAAASSSHKVSESMDDGGSDTDRLSRPFGRFTPDPPRTTQVLSFLTSQDPIPGLRCPLPDCPRSLLAAVDALRLLEPADFDAYAKRRLQVGG